MSEKVELFGGRGEFQLELDFSWRSSRHLKTVARAGLSLKVRSGCPDSVFKDLNVMDDSQTCCSDRFTIYTNSELCCTPETNVLVSIILQLKKKKKTGRINKKLMKMGTYREWVAMEHRAWEQDLSGNSFLYSFDFDPHESLHILKIMYHFY